MQTREFKAKWIWTENAHIANERVVFRKTFTVAHLPKAALAYVAVDTKYNLYVNGKEAVIEGGLFRESRPGCGYYDTVDLAPYLKQGDNIIALLVHYFGNSGRNNIDSGQAGLLFECPAIDIYSDASFLCLTHPAYYTPKDPSPSYLFGGDNLGFDANLDIGDFTKLGFDDTRFDAATEFENQVWGQLYERPIPLHYVGKESAAEQVLTEGKTFTAVLPHAMAFFPTLTVLARGGETLDIRTDRYLVPGGPPNSRQEQYPSHRIEYICKPGYNHFESSLYLFGEQLIVTCPEPVEIRTLGFRESGYDTRIEGDFFCSSDLLNRLVKKSARTLYVCMRDNFMDCPDRERSQWIGDTSVQIPQLAFLLGPSARLLARKAISDFVELRKGDILLGNIPGRDANELPCQNLCAIGEWGLLGQYYKYTGDLEALRSAFEPSVRYLQLWELDSRGLIKHREGDWPWYDNMFNSDGPIIENCWYVIALKFALRVAGLLDDRRFDGFLTERIRSISSTFESAYWKGTYYSSGTLVDDRANALAVLAGLCPKKNFYHVRRVLLGVFNATTFMENYILIALCEMGYIKDAYERMASRYYGMAYNDNSTLWETFFILGTKNHAWSGAPATLAFRYFMGIDTLDGFKTFTVHPCYELFEQMSCRFYAKDGPVSIHVDKAEGIRVTNASSSAYLADF